MTARRLNHSTSKSPARTGGDDDWRADAVCAQADPHIFHPDAGGDSAYNTSDAKRLCNGNPKRGIPPCPVKEQCRAWALEQPVQFGVWGGLSQRELRRLKKESA